MLGLVDTLLLGLGIALMLEGLWPMLAPDHYQRFLAQLHSQMTARHLQNYGVLLVIVGAAIVWWRLSG